MNAIHPLQTRVERLWGAYLEAEKKAKATLKMEDGIAAGRAWGIFMREYEIFPESACSLPRESLPQIPYIHFIYTVLKGLDKANKRRVILSAYGFGFIDDEETDFLFSYYKLDHQNDLLSATSDMEDD